MSTQIFYNGQEILAGSMPQPTPFVGRQDTMINYGGDRWADKTTLSLEGQITGECFNPFSGLVEAQNNLVNAFSKDFQRFEIIENGSGVFSADYVMVRTIDFPASDYAHIMNYTVTLDCYKQELFSGFFGVLDPTDEWKYDEKLDYTVSLNHTVSARGINTSDANTNALQNARSFVSTRTGIIGAIPPVLIQSKSGTLTFCLKDIHEKIDRFNGVYGIEENYVGDAYYGNDGLLRFTTNFDCQALQGIARLTVQGEIDGCGRSSDINALRLRYSGLNIGQLAQSAYSSVGGVGVLNTGYISQGVTEDPFNKKLTFNSVYDNNPDPIVYIDYTVGIDLSDTEITTVNFRGTIKGRGDINARWNNVQAFYSTFDPLPLALTAYNDFSPDSIFPLNTAPLNDSTTFNKFTAEISINKSWDNKDIPPGGFKILSYTLHFTPSLEKISFTPLANLCGTQYYIVDLGYQTRSSFSVDGRGKICAPNSIDDGVLFVRQLGNSLFSTYSSANRATLDEKQITTSNQEVGFRFGWSAQPTNSVTFPGSYSAVNSLSLL